jgi:hypothetical protein
MYLSSAQLARSLEELDDVHTFFGTVFLAMKQVFLPIGSALEPLNFTETVEQVLWRYYKPLRTHNGFYSPFSTSNKRNRWQKERYASTTLQRITVDTFGAAFIHEKYSQQWGWSFEYLDVLEKHAPVKIPVFHLAVWLFRQEDFPDGDLSHLLDRFAQRFNISPFEAGALFNWEIPARAVELVEESLSDSDVLALIGYPPDAATTANGILGEITLQNVGPGPLIEYCPSERLNLITGDNSLGKTFLFDCIWWALTKQWPGLPAQPFADELAPPRPASISYQLASYTGLDRRSVTVSTVYERDKQRWREPKKETVEAGLALYARIDGSFVIWDATTRELGNTAHRDDRAGSLYLDEKAVWSGLPNAKGGQLCNGLIQDWTTWQRSGAYYAREWNALEECLKRLSPDPKHPLKAGRPERISVDDTRDIPVIQMPYGNVPVIHASAGVRRILAMAYMLVWTWLRHQGNAKLLGQSPQYRLILIIDEAEAHLHPRWQRVIVPALMSAVRSLEDALTPQIHLATHSPLVMASAEEVFDADTDTSHHLQMTREGRVEMKELDFYKRGTVDKWLMADEFDLELPRSRASEEVVRQALAIQLEPADTITQDKVRVIDRKLRALLGERDDFWPRWLYFAQKHGVQE